MKVIMNLKIKPEDFYDLIINSLIYDIEKNGKIISTEIRISISKNINKQNRETRKIKSYDYML